LSQAEQFKANQARIAAALGMGRGRRTKPQNREESKTIDQKLKKRNIFEEDGDDILKFTISKPSMKYRSKRKGKRYNLD